MMKIDVKSGLKKMKWGKTKGSDGFGMEMVEALGEFPIDKIVEIAKKVLLHRSFTSMNEGV